MEKKYVITESEMKLIAETFYGECMGCDVSNECEGCPKMSEESIQKFWKSRELTDHEALVSLNRELVTALDGIKTFLEMQNERTESLLIGIDELLIRSRGTTGDIKASAATMIAVANDLKEKYGEESFEGFYITCRKCGTRAQLYENGGAWWVTEGKIKALGHEDKDDPDTYGFQCECGNTVIDI